MKSIPVIPWYIKILLFFKSDKFYEDDSENLGILYKVLFNKIYILKEYLIPPKHFNCRCDLQINQNTGENER